MAKRTLGLGKAAKAKKHKPGKEEKGNEIHVELDDEADPDDELAQLKGLWETYRLTRDNEMVLNGVIHECDRLLRNQTEDQKKLPAELHSIYALALADLTIFNTQVDEDSPIDIENIKQIFDAALERAELGSEQYPDSIELGFAKAGIIFNRIPLQYISQWDLDTKKQNGIVDVAKLLDEALASYEKSEASVKMLQNYSLLNQNVFEALKALDDLLDIISNFGRQVNEGLDSDNESEDENEVKLSKKHPLHQVANTDKYSSWLVDHGTSFGDMVSKVHKRLLQKEELSASEAKNLAFFKAVSLTVGQLLLQAAEKPSTIFTMMAYDSDVEEEEIEGYSAKDAQDAALKYTTKAIEFMKNAEDAEVPQTWVDVAEALIDLGNLHDNESEAQAEAYAEAEKRLERANNATNGKYQVILDNLLNN